MLQKLLKELQLIRYKVKFINEIDKIIFLIEDKACV